MKCFECGAKMQSKRETYKFTESGLPSVSLGNVEVRACTKCGEREVVLPKLEELHRAIAHMVLLKTERLAGEEIRYLRKYLGWSAVDFAKRIGVDRTTVSRWENGQQSIGTTADRLLRLLVVTEKPVEDYSTERLTVIKNKAAKPRRLRFQLKRGSWATAAA